jgi:acyl carrier protein
VWPSEEKRRHARSCADGEVTIAVVRPLDHDRLFLHTGPPTMHSLNTVETINDIFSIVVGIIRIVSAKAKPMEITPHSLLLEELALDSLDLVRVIMLIEDRYHTAIDLDEIPKMKRVDDLTRILSRELRSAA